MDRIATRTTMRSYRRARRSRVDLLRRARFRRRGQRRWVSSMCQHHLSAAEHRHTPFEHGARSAGTKSRSPDYLAARLFPNGESLEQAANLSFRFSALARTNADAGLATNPG